MRGRRGPLIVMAAALIAVGLAMTIDPPPTIIWNASPSVPIGFYTVRDARGLRVGELVAVMPPEPLASWLDTRGYLPRGVPLLKPVAALPGQCICRHGSSITIDGAAPVTARERDRAGRPLPIWQGCRIVGAGELFLMNPAQPDSLDGRYFGVLPMTAVIGRAAPLWTFEEP